ncbi:hypothetical protein CRM90_29595 [Mycobacterium sp. ENV421]|uniref:DUF6262 family protein n=2 Tax=Mycobacteriaceae TaxID=1762 RepID=UPI00024A26F9|nr:DUF6262 family protein [Mycolicibacterium tusciae]PND54153.1 hypothetical protein CRM90_29595 [Mycobacterium sp. ENV421]
MTRTTNPQTQPMLDGRRDDSGRRRKRVLAVLDQAAAAGDPISASAIARAAGVDRTFLYRHRDLLEKIHALQADPVHLNSDHAVTHASLRADLLAAHERAARLNTRNHQLEKRLSEALGEHTWRESGLGSPVDIDALHQRISQLEHDNLDLQHQLEERDDDLTAARAANRELMARLNTPSRPQ